MTDKTTAERAGRFTKKPVTIAAIQWTGKNLREVITFTDGPPDTRTTHAGMAWEAYIDLVARDGLKIYTLEGKMLASPGDWIIRGVKGEYYPCKPDIFEATYSSASLPLPGAQEAVARDGWLHENGLLYRLTDERHPSNRDEISVTMADGSRSVASRSRRALELLDVIRSSAPQPALSAGWVMVPVEPTEPMLDAVDEEVGGHCYSCSKWIASADDCRRVWSAMIAAATPLPPSPSMDGESNG